MSEFCRLARESLAYWLKHGRKLKARQPVGVRAGCFISLHDSESKLRGCIGTIEPVHNDLVLEIIDNAVSAGTRDPRFPPVSIEELSELQVEVSVLQEPQPVVDESDLDPLKYGVIVRRDARRGILLPDIEGVDTVARQLAITRKKAAIDPDEPVSLWRFEVKKYHENRG